MALARRAPVPVHTHPVAAVFLGWVCWANLGTAVVTLPPDPTVGYSGPMTNVLCIETSGAHCSLALSVSGQLYHRDRQLQRSHNQRLLKLLDELCTQAEVLPRQLDVVAFGCGPGSFTGVRIAAAACQAIALAGDAAVVTLPSSLALALSAQQAQPQAAGYLCSIKSRGEAYYQSAYVPAAPPNGADSLGVQCIEPDVLVDAPPSWLAQQSVSRWVGVGTPPTWWPQTLELAWLPDIAPSALHSLDWVLQQHAAGASQPAESALPRYVEGDSPWKKSA